MRQSCFILRLCVCYSAIESGNKEGVHHLLESVFSALPSFGFSSSFISVRGQKDSFFPIERDGRTCPRWLWELTGFLLLSVLLVVVDSGSFRRLLVIRRISPPALAFVLRVGKLFVAGDPLIGGADWNQTRATVSTLATSVVRWQDDAENKKRFWCKKKKKLPKYGAFSRGWLSARGVRVVLDKRLSGSSVSSSALSSGAASSGMACICTPGAWGSILRFSKSRCLKRAEPALPLER